MYRRLVYTTCIAVLLGLAGLAQAEVFSDNFDSARDYLVEGTEGTGWDGFIGRGANETVDSLNASKDRAGALFLKSTGARWEPAFTPEGPFLYKVVPGDFIATVHVVDFAGTSGATVLHNDSMLMARVANIDDAGSGEDFVSVHYFPTWAPGNLRRSIDDGVEDEAAGTGDGFNCAKYIQLERVGNTFYFRRSFDGVTWTQVPSSPVTRDDLDGLPLQVGLAQCTYNTTTGYVAFDDFTISGPNVIPPNKAYGPTPGDKATDVLRSVIPGWAAAAGAVAHDVYFGTDSSAVASATRANPLNVLVSQAQTATTYDPGILTYGQAYYWRVDEVRADGTTIDQGMVWKFTVEPYGYPIAGVTATASSAAKNMGPEKTVDNSGLDLATDQHSTDSKAMWLSDRKGAQPTWIQFAFDKAYKLHELWVWNSNQGAEASVGFGAKDVTVEYSADGITWTALGEFEFTQAPASDDYVHDTTVNFAGVMAKYVKLTINTNWGEVLPQYGLSEVRFFYVPVSAREPKPATGATGVDPQVVLSWRAGREAASHNVYLGTDEQAVTNDTANATSVSQPSYETAVNLSQSYFWKVVEVNEAESPATWDGPVWNFSTADYLVIEDFESYTNDSPFRVFQTWIDGAGFSADDFFPTGNSGNGSGALVGYDPTAGNIMETTLIHGDRQSMPLYYDNSSGTRYSEATRTFESPQDWSKYGVTTLVVWFRGDVNNVAAPVYAKINGTKVTFNNGATVTALPVWKQWNITLSSVAGLNLKSIKTLAIGVGDGSAGGTGTIYVDDIRLYAIAPPLPATPTDPGTNGLTLLYAFENNTSDTSGKKLDGIASGDPLYVQSVSGKGKALQFDGLNDYVDLPIASMLSTMTNATFALWVNVVGSGAWQRAFDFGTGETNYMFLTPSTGRGPRFAITNVGGTDESIADSPMALGTGWHHLAVVIDAASMTLRLYQDGALTGSGATTLLPKDLGTNTQIWLGRSQYTVDPFYNGGLDDFRIYNRALSEAEIRYLAGDR